MPRILIEGSAQRRRGTTISIVGGLLAVAILCGPLTSQSDPTTSPSTAETRPSESSPTGLSLSSTEMLIEMADSTALTKKPSVRFTTEIYSSLDPRAKRDDDKSEPFYGTERRGERWERILCETKGPGAIVKIAVTKAVGTLRIYCDGSPIPVFDVPADLAVRGDITLVSSPFSAKLGDGGVIRFPFPFAESVKVTIDDPSPRFEVVVRRFPEGTRLTSFAVKEALIATFPARTSIGSLFGPASSADFDSKTTGATTVVAAPDATLILPAGGEQVLFDRKSTEPECITLIGFADPADGDPLRFAHFFDIRISIFFDDEPCVNATLADLLAMGPSSATPSTFWIGGEPGTFFLRRISYRMPYRRSARIVARNVGKDDIAGIFMLVKKEPAPFSSETLYFHAAGADERKKFAGHRWVGSLRKTNGARPDLAQGRFDAIFPYAGAGGVLMTFALDAPWSEKATGTDRLGGIFGESTVLDYFYAPPKDPAK